MKTTTFLGVFRQRFPSGDDEKETRIERIEIPMIQRDYAQGRANDNVPKIRRAFLRALRTALVEGPPICLDFIYGEVEEQKLVPLDGQQRLTTLFLLHWYISLRAGRHEDNDSLRLGAFSYETRPSARSFCQKLVQQRPVFPLAEASSPDEVSSWLCDQHWFRLGWQRDPTIASMLVVLDAIHEHFGGIDHVSAWERLASARRPAIEFHFLPISDIGGTDDLYIKMNSRGKPLTPFENFKARFEKILRSTSEVNYVTFSERIDNQWTDLLWPLRDTNHLIDDRFMRFYRFVTEAIGWWLDPATRDSQARLDDDEQARRTYGLDNPGGAIAACRNQHFLFSALDCWPVDEHRGHTGETFKRNLAANSHEPGKVTLFNDEVDLFAACCRAYEVHRPGARSRLKFTLQHTLILFAMMLHRIENTPDFGSRLRTLRNLVLASGDEVRRDRMPGLLADAAAIVRSTDATVRTTFGKALVVAEERRREFVDSNPQLRGTCERLEDHPLLRGQLAVVELASERFAERATVFETLFASSAGLPTGLLSGALLSCGDYSWQSRYDRFRLLGANFSLSWRELFTGGEKRADQLSRTKRALVCMLDAVHTAPPEQLATESLQATIDSFVGGREAERRLNWRYYLAKYPIMRTGRSGYYVGERIDLDLCMLETNHLNSWYRDPFLSAIVGLTDAESPADVERLEYKGAIGYEEYPGRWLVVAESGAAFCCRADGFELRRPTNAAYDEAFRELIEVRLIGADLRVRVEQASDESGIHDVEDRVVAGADLLQAMLSLRAGSAGAGREDAQVDRG